MKTRALLLFTFIFAVQAPAFAGSDSQSASQKPKVLGQLPKAPETATEALIAKTEEQAIEALVAIIKHRDEPELYYRLAELYMRQSKSARYFESLHKGVKMDVSVPGIKAALKNAIETYTHIEKTWPKFVDLDGVLFNHGLACLLNNDTPCAQNRMETLLSSYPKSRWIPDANLTLGEIHYDKHDFAKALHYYGAVPEGRTYSYAQYKSAWSHYNLKDNSKAIHTMKGVVRLPKSGETSLITEALRDLALFLESDSQPHKYLQFFKEVCGKACGTTEISDTLIALGNLLSSHDKLKEIEGLSTELSTQSQYKPTRVKIVLILASSFDKQPVKKNLHDRVIASLKEGFALCYEGKPQATKSELKFESCDELISLTKEFAKKWTEVNKAPRWTLQALDLLIAHEKQKDETLHLARAELQFQLNEFKAAEAEYASTSEWLCAEFQPAKKAPAPVTLKPADTAAVSAKTDDEAPVETPEAKKARRADICEKMAYGALVSADRAQMKNSVIISRALFYAQLPDSLSVASKREEVSLSLGLRYFQEKNEKDAEIWLKKVQSSEVAQDLLLKIMTNQKRYQDLKDLSQSFALTTKDETRKQSLLTVSEQAHYQLVQLKKDPELILQFAFEHEPSALAESALWQVISVRHKDKFVLAGADLCMYLNKHYPKSTHSHECQEIALQDYQVAGDASAAKALESKMADEGVEPYASNRKLAALEKRLENKEWNEVYNEATHITKVATHAEIKARAQWIRARVFEHELDSQSTKTSLQRLPYVLSIKAERLEKTQQTYTSVLKMTGNPALKREAIEGLLRSLQSFVMDLKEPRLTEEIPQEQLTSLRQQLAEVRSPAEQRIVELQQQLQEMKP
jgi:TolA-binding protein